MKNVLTWFFWIAMAMVGVIYGFNVLERNQAKKWTEEFSSEDGGSYTARYASVGRDNYVLRIYKTGCDEILAERVFNWPAPMTLDWKRDKLIYDNDFSSVVYGGTIRLPPTWLDRVLAKLP